MIVFLKKMLTPDEFNLLDLRFGLTSKNRILGPKLRTQVEIGRRYKVTNEAVR